MQRRGRIHSCSNDSGQQLLLREQQRHLLLRDPVDPLIRGFVFMMILPHGDCTTKRQQGQYIMVLVTVRMLMHVSDSESVTRRQHHNLTTVPGTPYLL